MWNAHMNTSSQCINDRVRRSIFIHSFIAFCINLHLVHMEAYSSVAQRAAAVTGCWRAGTTNNVVQNDSKSKRMKCAFSFNEICELANDDDSIKEPQPHSNNKFQNYNFNVIIYEWKLRCVTFLDSC